MTEPDPTRSPWSLCVKCGLPARDCLHGVDEVQTCPTWTVENWCICANPKAEHVIFSVR